MSVHTDPITERTLVAISELHQRFGPQPSVARGQSDEQLAVDRQTDAGYEAYTTRIVGRPAALPSPHPPWWNRCARVT